MISFELSLSCQSRSNLKSSLSITEPSQSQAVPLMPELGDTTSSLGHQSRYDQCQVVTFASSILSKLVRRQQRPRMKPTTTRSVTRRIRTSTPSAPYARLSTKIHVRILHISILARDTHPTTRELLPCTQRAMLTKQAIHHISDVHAHAHARTRRPHQTRIKQDTRETYVCTQTHIILHPSSPELGLPLIVAVDYTYPYCLAIIFLVDLHMGSCQSVLATYHPLQQPACTPPSKTRT